MSARGARREPSADEIRKATEAAEKKAQDLVEQVKRERAWLDEATKSMSEGEKDELFRHASAKCQETSRKDGKIIQACPMPKKLEYCANADPFTCPNGKVSTGRGCKPSDKVSNALRDDTTCIDANFIAEAEGGSYLSPYVPWGPISGASSDGLPRLTQGNSSGATIGTGVDLGAVKRKEEYLQHLEEIGVSKTTRERIAPLLGKKKEDACKALREAKQTGPIVLPPEDVELIDIDAMQSRLSTLKSQFARAHKDRIQQLNNEIDQELGRKDEMPDQSKINNWRKLIASTQEFGDLTCTQQSVLFSTVYHEGSIFGGRTKAGILRQPHKEALVDALLSGDDVAARVALVEKTKNANGLIASRGTRELSYFDDGE